MSSVHQIIIGSSKRDAITNMSLRLRDALSVKYTASVYSYFAPDESTQSEVLPLSKFPAGNKDDVIIYHSSFGIKEITEFLLNRPEKLVLIYHNITPSKHYQSTDPIFAEQLDWGRQELSLLSSRTLLSFADSQYNAQDLGNYGYKNIRTVPVGVNPHRLDRFPTNTKFLGELTQTFPNGFVLFVSQVLQHKRVELAIEMVHLLRSVWRLDVGLVIAGPNRKQQYRRDLEALRKRFSDAHLIFTDEIGESELATLFRTCLVFISTSEHEGLSIPPLEAMVAGAPIVARAAGAVAETVQNAGILVPLESGVGEFAGAVARVISDAELRTELINRGFDRVRDFSEIDNTSVVVAGIEEIM